MRTPTIFALRKHRPRSEFCTGVAWSTSDQSRAPSTRRHTGGTRTLWPTRSRTQRWAVQGGPRVGATSRNVGMCEGVIRPGAALMHARPHMIRAGHTDAARAQGTLHAQGYRRWCGRRGNGSTTTRCAHRECSAGKFPPRGTRVGYTLEALQRGAPPRGTRGTRCSPADRHLDAASR